MTTCGAKGCFPFMLLFCLVGSQDTGHCNAESCGAMKDKGVVDLTSMIQSRAAVQRVIDTDEDSTEAFSQPAFGNRARPGPEPEPEPESEPEPEAEPEPESEAEAESATNAQFLITATFGPTRKTLNEKKNMTYQAWISKQIKLPLSSHREYFRARANPDLPSATCPLRDTCGKGSRWTDTLFSLHDVQTKAHVTVANNTISVNGKLRTLLNPSMSVKQCTDITPPGNRYLGGQACKDHAVLNSRPWQYCHRHDWRQAKWCQQTCFNHGRGYAGDDCSGGWVNKTMQYYICPRGFTKTQGALLSFCADTSCGNRRRNAAVIKLPQISVWGNGSTPDVPSTLFETSKHTGTALFLKTGQGAQSSTCAHLKSGLIKVGARFLIPDSRCDLAENTPAKPMTGNACAPRTFLNKGACKIGTIQSACPLTCGSPGEIANEPTQGHLFPIYTSPSHDRRRRGMTDGAYMLDTRRNVPQNLGKSMVWTEIILKSHDQLRQRVAWAMSQVIVVGISGFPGAEKETECWTYFYDIMVRNAFGNFKDILREVTYSPVMATYLTYLNSESFDSKGSAPDENYAREIMQLFTIGLEKLDKNGVKIKDNRTNASVPTYTSQHIVNFARVFTGFTERTNRGNIEASQGNRVDPMVLDSTFHDKYPKPDLNGGYVGDRYPLCTDMPKDAFLQKGATYEFVGLKSYWNVPRGSLIGPGHCRSGHIGSTRNVDLATCLASCKSDARCRFVSAWVNRDCARYDSRASDCKHRHMNMNYKSYKLDRGPEGAVFPPQAVALEGVLHLVTNCNQCGTAFCSGSLWKKNVPNVESTYKMGSHLADWGCDDLPTPLVVVRNSQTGTIYVVKAGVLHHVTSCHQCGKPMCSHTMWQKNVPNVESAYTMGSRLADQGCAKLPTPLVVVRNSQTGSIYAVEAQTTTTTTAQALSGLRAALNSAQPSVTLSQDIPCTGLECKLDTMDMVAAGDFLYAFVKPKCVWNFFMPAAKEINCTTTQVLDPDTQPYCCVPGSAPAPVAGIQEEQFYFTQGGNIPNLNGRTADKSRRVDKVYYQNSGGTWPGWNRRDHFVGRWTGSLVITTGGTYTFSTFSDDGSKLHIGTPFTLVVNNDGLHGWRKSSSSKALTPGAHSLKVEMFERGGHAGIDVKYNGADTNNQEIQVPGSALQVTPPTCPRPVKADIVLLPGGEVTSNVAANGFPVIWENGNVPPVSAPTPHAATIEERRVFSQVPPVAALPQLFIGAFKPKIACSHSCTGPVKGYAVDGTTIDEKTVFEYNGTYYKNSMSVVQYGTSSHVFRNPPVFMQPQPGASKHELDEAVAAEVEAVIDHLFHHQNTPFNLARKLIQRLTMSNPPLQYLQDVAAAFRTGKFNGTTYSGVYGDMGAMVAAIFLHPEARIHNTTASGALREPTLKIMHFIRSMEYVDDSDEPVVFKELVSVIGQFPYYSPTVFNYYDADYMPMNFGMGGMMPMMPTPKPSPSPKAEPEPEPEPEPEAEQEPLVAPEFQILIPPLLLGWLNGMRSMTRHGISHCDKGFGQDAGIGCLQGYFDADTTIGDLNMLLTGGRMTKHHIGTLRAAWKNALRRNEWPGQAAKQAMIFMPEFHTLGDPVPQGIRGPEPPPTKTNPAAYKALVMLFLAGGADTFNMLVPRDCPLHANYAKARQGCNIAMNQLLAIQADTQNCTKFGIHPSMPRLKNLYVAKEAAFISNIGALTAPSTRFNLVGRCPNQGSHSHGQMAAQTLNCMGVGLFTGNGGVAGKLADELAAAHNWKTSSFSISGKPAWSESIRTKVQIFDGRNGVIRLEGYADFKATIKSITDEKLGNVFADEYTIAFRDAVNSSESFSTFLNDPRYNPPNYGTPSGLSRQLLQVSKLIATRATRKAERDFFWTNIGGWDMHGNINTALPRNLGQVDEAINTFVTELKRQQVFDKTVLITASDFARTLTFNGAGTDHAWAANHIIVGGAVNGGVVYNDFLKDYIVGPTNDQVMDTRGRVVPKYPWENMMVPIAKWLGVNETSLNKMFPNLPNFNRSTHIISEHVLFKNGTWSGSPTSPGGSGSGSGGSGSGGSGTR